MGAEVPTRDWRLSSLLLVNRAREALPKDWLPLWSPAVRSSLNLPCGSADSHRCLNTRQDPEGTQRERRAGLCSIPRSLVVGGNVMQTVMRSCAVTLILAFSERLRVPVPRPATITCKDCEKLLRPPCLSFLICKQMGIGLLGELN